MKSIRSRFLLVAAVLAFAGCSDKSSTSATGGAEAKSLTLGVAFETLQTEYWIAGYDAIKSECTKRGFKVAEAVADNDANRQLEQVKNFITRKVDGIILVPKDASTCIPMIKAA